MTNFLIPFSVRRSGLWWAVYTHSLTDSVANCPNPSDFAGITDWQWSRRGAQNRLLLLSSRDTIFAALQAFRISKGEPQCCYGMDSVCYICDTADFVERSFCLRLATFAGRYVSARCI